MVARDAVAYIRAWRWLLWFRGHCGHEVDWRRGQTTGYLSSEQRQGVFQSYLAHFKEKHFRQVKGKGQNMKSQAEARLRRMAGSRIAALIIWEIGMPPVPRALATEQRVDERRESVHAYATLLVHWLTVVANALKGHKSMSHYSTALLRSGTVHGVSPLTPKELKLRAEAVDAMQLWRRGRRAQAALAQGARVTDQDLDLIHALETGDLDRVIADIRGRRGVQELRLGILVPR